MSNSSIEIEEKQSSIENLTLLRILNYVPIFIFLLGIIGNTFSFLIFLKLGKIKFTLKKLKINFLTKCHRKKKQETFRKDNRVSNGVFTVYIYLAILAVFDLSVLFFGLFNDFLTDTGIYNFKLYSSSFCKSISFFAFFSSHFSSWLLVVVSSIRLLAIYSPYRATQLTKTNNVRRVCFVLMTILASVNLHLYWNMEIKEIDRVEYLSDSLKESMLIQSVDKEEILNQTSLSNETYSFPIVSDESIWKYECKIKKNAFTQNVWPIADKLIYCFLPFTLLIIINSLIVLNIKKSQNYKYILYVSKLISPNGQGFDSYSGCDIELENLTEKIKNIRINELNCGNVDAKTINFLKKLPYLTENEKNLKISRKTSKSLDIQKINRLRTIEIKEKIIKYKKYHLIGRKFTYMLLGVSFTFLVIPFNPFLLCF